MSVHTLPLWLNTWAIRELCCLNFLRTHCRYRNVPVLCLDDYSRYQGMKLVCICHFKAPHDLKHCLHTSHIRWEQLDPSCECVDASSHGTSQWKIYIHHMKNGAPNYQCKNDTSGLPYWWKIHCKYLIKMSAPIYVYADAPSRFPYIWKTASS